MIKIKSIQFFNHQIFGNQTFDFTKNGVIADNIILAGENGSGKTKLLQELYEINNINFNNTTEIYARKLKCVYLDISDLGYFDSNNINNKITEAKLVVSKSDGGSLSGTVSFLSSGSVIRNVKRNINGDNIYVFNLKSLYSKVDINYIPNRSIDGITNKKLDEETNNNNIPSDIAREMKQLFIDVASQDYNDLGNWVTEHRNQVPPTDILLSRIRRFTSAFYSMFGDELKYKKVIDNTKVIFQKNGCDIEIDQLSSGEKQVIYRGIYLLRNKNSLKGVPVLIDEPEISMHPKWESKIFDYYTGLFKDDDDNQTSQIFMATHSEHILENNLNDDKTLIIKMYNGSYEKYEDSMILSVPTIAEVKYSIFDLYTVDFHIALYGYIQQNLVPHNDPTIKQTDIWLQTQHVTLMHYSAVVRGVTKEYETLQTYIRNCIDHPDNNHSYLPEEFKESIEQMIEIIRNNR